MTTIALDVMGSDRGASALVGGAAQASLLPNAPSILLVGHRDAIRFELDRVEHDAARLEIVHAPTFIGQEDKPREAVSEKSEASILIASKMVHSREADVLVSAGNTGAVTLACATIFGRLPNIQRTALGSVYPTERRRGIKNDPFSLILDVGLTLEASADDLVGFAIMGAAYAQRISRNERPRVALLSVGSEAGKGTKAIVEAHSRLKNAVDFDFIGNIEGMDIPKGTADVVVTSGFTGNIVLKMLEGISDTMMRLVGYAGEKNARYKMGLALLEPAVRKLRQSTDWEQYGGAPILGFNRLCIKAHGRSTERAISNAIKVARRSVETGLVDAMKDGLERFV